LEELSLDKYFVTYFEIRCGGTLYISGFLIMLLGHGDFSFDFAENISKFVILRRNIEKIRSFCKFCGVGLNV